MIANWADFQSPDNLKAFARRHDVAITKTGYGSEEELLAKVGAGATGFDLVVPGGGGLATMVGRGEALALDHERIPNLRHLSPQFADPEYDPGNRHSVPKDYGITSFWWRAGVVDPEPRTIADCFDALPRLRGASVNFIESANETINAALAATGESINTTDPAALDRAKDLLLSVKPYVDTISTTYIERGQRGEIDFGLGYNGDVSRIRAERVKRGDDVRFLVPDGPAQGYVDLWVVPAAAEHPVAAHAFIDYVLDPRAAARELEYTQFGSPVAGVERFAPAAAADPIVSIPAAAMARYEVALPYEPAVARRRNEIYTAFKAA